VSSFGTTAAIPIYHSGQFSVDRKFSHGLLLRAAYTYSKLIDDGSEVFTTTGNSTFSQVITQQGSDRSLSAYDRRNRFVASYIWELPMSTTRETRPGAAVVTLRVDGAGPARSRRRLEIRKRSASDLTAMEMATAGTTGPPLEI